MIQISGSSDRAIIDLEQGDYEGLDQLNIARPFAKAAYRVNRPEDICTGLSEPSAPPCRDVRAEFIWT